MINKDLLVVYNSFGGGKDATQYIEGLKKIFWHIDKNNLHDNVRVVLSSVLNMDECIDKIINEFGNKLRIFRYLDRWPLQVSLNKTILSSIDEFQEEYNGYLYISAGVYLTEIDDLFPRIIEKNNTNEYGIMHLYVNADNCHEHMVEVPGEQSNINYYHDFQIPIKRHTNFIAAVLNKSLKDFYGVPVTDVFGRCGMEIALSFMCAALRKKYILLGNSYTVHETKTDSGTPEENSVAYSSFETPIGLMWGRTHDIFENDIEGRDSGLGYWPGHYTTNTPWKVYFLEPDLSKFDENHLSLDERLKFAVKRCFFTNQNELDYSLIKYNLI